MAISKSDAEGYVKNYLELRESLLSQSSMEDQRLSTYYGSDQISFIFSKERIDELFEGQEANSLRIYDGAYNSGEPTLVIVPCLVNEDETSVINAKARDQHPKPKIKGFIGDKSNFDIDNDLSTTSQ